MKEKDIRERIHTFLRDTVRHVVVPASMGIGLALVGCSDSSSNPSPDGSADASSVQPGTGGSGGSPSSTQSGAGGVTGTSGIGGAVALYMAMMTDAGGGTGGTTGITPMYMARMPDAGLPVADYMAMMPVEPSSHDAGRGIVALYAAPVPANK